MGSVYHFVNSVYDITSDDDKRHYALDNACVSHGGEYVLQVLLNYMCKNQNVLDDISYVAKNYIVFSLRRFGYVLSDNDEERHLSLKKAILIYGKDYTIERLVLMQKNNNNAKYISQITNDISFIKTSYNFATTKRSICLRNLLKNCVMFFDKIKVI